MLHLGILPFRVQHGCSYLGCLYCYSYFISLTLFVIWFVIYILFLLVLLPINSIFCTLASNKYDGKKEKSFSYDYCLLYTTFLCGIENNFCCVPMWIFSFRYLSLLDKHPVLTKAVTSALLTLIGDLICQVQFAQVPLSLWWSMFLMCSSAFLFLRMFFFFPISLTATIGGVCCIFSAYFHSSSCTSFRF